MYSGYHSPFFLISLLLTGESIHLSELQVATAAQSYNLAPWYAVNL